MPNSTTIREFKKSNLFANNAALVTTRLRRRICCVPESIQPPLTVGPYRLATIEEIIAMKIDIVQRLARKKDFWYLHELLDQYNPDQMIQLHQLRYPYNHDKTVIRKNFADFSNADDDFDPICLKGKYWELIKLDINNALKK